VKAEEAAWEELRNGHRAASFERRERAARREVSMTILLLTVPAVLITVLWVLAYRVKDPAPQWVSTDPADPTVDEIRGV
jgi:hypothetical protein